MPAPEVVTLTGLQPTLSGLTDTFIDWGDTGGRVTTAFTDPVPVGGYTLTHTYAVDGTYEIQWGFHSDTEHVLKLSVSVSGAPGPAPAPTLSLSPAATGYDATVNDDVAQPWTEWTLDFGDGNYAAGTDQPTGSVNHDYGGTPPPTAILTIVGPDGQLTTASYPSA